MRSAPAWIENLIDTDWTPEASLAVDRWLAYAESEFTGKTLKAGNYDVFQALVASLVGHPNKPAVKALLKAIAISNGQPLALVERLFVEMGGAL